ncbi:MAG: CRISPR-associated endonuclease Cas2 [Chromatiaceae bacterium]
MPIQARKSYLLSYDIADPDRLVRVHRTVRRWGIPLQYSVFLVPTDVTGLQDLLGELKALIDERADDIRVYPLPARLEVVRYGRQALPSGVDLVGTDAASAGVAELVG